MADDRVNDILHKYERKLGENVDLSAADLPDSKAFSREYDIFRKESLGGTDSFYENTARMFGNILTLRLKPEEEKTLHKAIEFSHLSIKPSDALGFAFFFGMAVIFLAILIIAVSGLSSVMADNGFRPMLAIPLLLMLFGALIIR